MREGLSQWLRTQASGLGFNRIRFADAAGAPGIAAYDAFLEANRHGQMGWMKTSRPPRAAPQTLLPGARSAVVLGIDYAWPRPPDPGGLTGMVSCYAWGRDYHNLMGKRLRRLQRALRVAYPDVGSYWGVDSRPLIERAWAARSGLGFIGKNCCILLPGESSYVFLAVLLLTASLPPDRPTVRDHCGRCRRCLDACPTDAFVDARQLDARRCISYLTIEHRGKIPEDLREGIGRWVFGCDLCQMVCPHNHTLRGGAHEDFQPRTGHAWLDLEWIMTAPDEAIRAHFQGSPIKRPGPAGLKRNAAVVLGNLGDPAARPALMKGLKHPDEAVRDHAQWALDRL
ncbi:MAG: tRNA epoxyqueuosine(34) reductase QueG [Myxococcota bacterium]